MKAETWNPAEIFGHHVRYVVPLFQRPYVWNRDEQWEPLWSDVRTVAERILDTPVGYGVEPVPPHFLGAVVVDQPLVLAGYIRTSHVVDGQQRLTTLQLLLDAAQLVTEQYGADIDAKALRVLVLNEPSIAANDDEIFKVWPTDRDQDAFRAAMTNDAPVPKDLATSAIAQCHRYFVNAISDWAEVVGDPDKAITKLNALTQALRTHLRLVVIHLEPGDNAQVIFETLNHRGTPLLAADLIKNLLFQVAQAQEIELNSLYQRRWRELDSDYWRQRIARGRQYVPRIDIFVNYWLVMRLLREVQSDRIFAEFRDHVMRERPDVEELMVGLRSDAQIYATMDSLSPASAAGRFYYRVIRAMDTAVVTPFFLWILRWPAESLPPAQRDKALRVMESWLVRRALCRLTSKDINRLMLDLLIKLNSAGPAAAGDVTEAFLLEQNADSRFWPSDDMVREALFQAPIYKALLRARVRMVLEALEDQLRSKMSEDVGCPRNLTVEHVMPQAWREHWAGDDPDDMAAARRDRLVHTLGNLTLVTSKLNPSMSNKPWTGADASARGLGNAGKWDALLEHSTLKLNAELVKINRETWTDQTIRDRTSNLIELILGIWSRPASPSPRITLSDAEPETAASGAGSGADAESGEAPTGKYKLLTEWLRAQGTDRPLPASFTDVEDVIGALLPSSARNHMAYWYSANTPLNRAVAAGGFKPTGVNLTAERVTFEPQ
jgi:hypothetical protein